MKNGMLGFTRKEILWFTTFFIVSFSLMAICTFRLIHKYYNHNVESAGNIKKNTHDLWAMQDMSHFAVNIQRGSLNMIIYSSNPKELETVRSSLQKNKDSLTYKLSKFEKENLIGGRIAQNIINFGRSYLEVNNKFIEHINDSIDRQPPEVFNVNIMRPTLRKFTDLIRQTSKDLTVDIDKTTEKGLNLLSLPEFWILCVIMLPYIYFFFRFLYLVLILILSDR